MRANLLDILCTYANNDDDLPPEITSEVIDVIGLLIHDSKICTAERDEARRIARQMKAERDEWRSRALEIAKAFKEYDDAAQGFEYTTPTD